MQIQGAVIAEQGVTFAIVIVKPSAMWTNLDADNMRAEAQQYFPRMPVVLASQNPDGSLQFQGRSDLVEFLLSIDPGRIPWKEYTFL